MRFVEWLREHHQAALTRRDDPEALHCRLNVGQRLQQLAQPADFDAQARAIRFVGAPGTERACDQFVPRDIAGPGFTEHASEREQQRAAGQRPLRSEEQTSELPPLMRNSYADLRLKKKNKQIQTCDNLL